jgi:hypothetical protein
MDFLDKTYDRASCEIDDILKHQKFDKQDVELLGDLVDIVKDIEMIYGYQDGMDMDGYSRMNGSSYMRGRSGRMMPMYGRGNSYARGRSMSNDNKDMLMDRLQDVMDMATDDKDRRAISKLIEQMDNQR